MQDSNEFSRKPKDKAKLKEKLQTLLIQHELKQSKKKTKTFVEKSNKTQEQVNGEPLQSKQKEQLESGNKKKHQKGSKSSPLKQQNTSNAGNKPKHKKSKGVAKETAHQETMNTVNKNQSLNSSKEKSTNKKAKKDKLKSMKSSPAQQKDSHGIPKQNNEPSTTIPKKLANKTKKLNKGKTTQTRSVQQQDLDNSSKQNKQHKSNPKNSRWQESDVSNHSINANKGPDSAAPIPNGQQIKKPKNKAKKRKASAQVEDKSELKKPKLGQQHVKKANNKNNKKSKQKQTFQNGKESSMSGASGHSTDEFDVNNMSGFVKGGDFQSDSNQDEDNYWGQQDRGNYNGTSLPNKENDMTNYGVDPYNYSDDDELENDPYDYSDFEEEGEEEENYSDFDENDYEEDEDSYDYSSDSEFSSSFGDNEDDTANSYDFNEVENDDDYKLPDNIPEDMIIHSGTATKRDIQPEDKVEFKDKKYCQIIELHEQNAVKITQQPKAYEKQELLKLTYRENHKVNVVNVLNEKNSECKSIGSDNCPKLVPIVDEDGFELYNHNEDSEDDNEFWEQNDVSSSTCEDECDSMEDVSLGSEYTEIDSDDADSFNSEDINEKYLNRSGKYDESFSDSDDDEQYKAFQKVDIINAKNHDYPGKNRRNVKNNVAESQQEEVCSSQLLFKKIKLASKANVLSTTIIVPKPKKETDTINEVTKKLPKTLENTNETKADIVNDNVDELYSSLDEIQTPIKQATKADLVNENVEELDSSLGEIQTPIEKATPSRLKSANQQSLTDYNTIFCNAINANIVLVLLKDPFYIYGTVRLTLLCGNVDIYGHHLAENQEVEIFSPRGCSVIEISSKCSKAKESSSKSLLKAKLKDLESNFILADLEKITKSYEAGKDAIILMKCNVERKKVVNQFKKFMNENVFPNIQNINMDRPLYNSEYLLRCMINTSAKEQKCLRLPDQWQSLAVKSDSRVLLAGGKGVGKSTLLRYLINRHITQYEQILVIDLDIGQPEIFVPQTVSCSVVTKPFLGPGFFLNIQPEKSFVVGHTNIALCPHRYRAAVSNLIDYCLKQQEFRRIPWFINTMGYNKGFGLELISLIIKDLPLTDIIQLNSNRDINNFDIKLIPQAVNEVPRTMFLEDVRQATNNMPTLSYYLHCWQTAVTQESRFQKEWDMSPKDLRYAMLLTRLSEALQGHADWLTDCKPMSAPLDQLKLINLVDGISSCSQDEIAKAMEASLVYLCHFENEVIECLGIGVVRAIDFHVRQVYLIPAISFSLLKDVNCLALGDMPLPSSMFTNQGSRVKNTAPFVYNTIAANSSKAIKQIYHRPPAFLKAKHVPVD